MDKNEIISRLNIKYPTIPFNVAVLDDSNFLDMLSKLLEESEREPMLPNKDLLYAGKMGGNAFTAQVSVSDTIAWIVSVCSTPDIKMQIVKSAVYIIPKFIKSFKRLRNNKERCVFFAVADLGENQDKVTVSDVERFYFMFKENDQNVTCPFAISSKFICDQQNRECRKLCGIKIEEKNTIISILQELDKREVLTFNSESERIVIKSYVEVKV